jgi:hypothetical protein
MKCRDVEGRLSAYLDGELDDAAASALRGHLRLCEACRRAADDHAAVIDAVSNLTPAEPPAAMWDGVLARLGEAEVADARRPGYWLWWRQLRPHMLSGLALAGAAATFSLWMWKRTGDAEPVARPEAVAAAPRAAAEPAPVPSRADDGRDVAVALDDDARALDDTYRAAAADLAALAAEERASWAPTAAAAFDAELAVRRAAVDAAAAGEPRERAWQSLIAFLQRAATGELVAFEPAAGEAR